MATKRRTTKKKATRKKAPKKKASGKMDRKWHRDKDGTYYWSSPEVSYYIAKERVFTQGKAFHYHGRLEYYAKRTIMWALYMMDHDMRGAYGRSHPSALSVHAKSWQLRAHYLTLKEAKAAAMKGRRS